jgi:hypothetical protein
MPSQRAGGDGAAFLSTVGRSGFFSVPVQAIVHCMQIETLAIFLEVYSLKVHVYILKRGVFQGGINSEISTDFDNIPKVWRSSFWVWRSSFWVWRSSLLSAVR